MSNPRLLSDIVLDSAFIAGAAAFSALGLSPVSPVLIGGMVASAIARKFIPRSEYDHLLAKLGINAPRINGSTMGQQWSNYLTLRNEALTQKASTLTGGIKRAWTLYGISLGAIAYWAMPFILAAGGRAFSGQYALILMLVGLHHLSIFAQYAEVRAWAKKRNQQDVSQKTI